MNKSAIKNFSIEARKLLIKMAVTEAGLYDITKDRCGTPIQKGTDFEVYRTIAGTENRIFGDVIKKRVNLVKAISEHGFESVMEEVAYTWFNRLIAVRFMEINDYLPSRVRVLSSETGSSTPDVVTKSLDVQLNMDANELDAVQKAKEDNKYDEAFRLLFIKQCNELNKILPGLFETTDDYMELLLRLSYTNDGVVRMLIDTVPEEDFDVSKEGQVEIIGWMYQYYNTELKDETFALLKKNVKVTKERIPAATQLFTPDWIVRYMVENSLGRLWIEHLRANDDSVDEKATAEEFGWKYYLPEAEQEESVNVKLAEVRKSYKDMLPLDIKCIDPCMGSGHILVYMFDVLMDIYKSAGYSERDAAFLILENNISGLDIDQRAYQLSYFALMMKGRGYNRRFFSGREIEQEGRTWSQYPSPDVRAIEESNELPSDIINQIEMNFPNAFNDRELACIDYVVKTFKDAKEYGSILNVDDEPDNQERQYASVALNLYSLIDGSHPFCMEHDLNILQRLLLAEAFPLIDNLLLQACVMSRKYDVVATNPPYMSSSNMSASLNKYLKKYYEAGKNDLFSAFIEKIASYTKKDGLFAMITMHSWMFLSRYKTLREKLLQMNLLSMVHLGSRAFEEISGEVVQTVSFVFRKDSLNDYCAKYSRLIAYSDASEKEKKLNNSGDIYICKQSNYDFMVDNIIAYWVSDSIYNLYKTEKLLGETSDSRQGIATGNNDMFLRLWYEVDFYKINYNAKNQEEMNDSDLLYVPYNKGGTFRRWYGNQDYVIKMDDTNYKKLLEMGNHLPSRQYYYNSGITWNDISTKLYCARLVDDGFIFDAAGPTCFYNGNKLYLLGFLNSIVAQEFLNIICQGLHYSTGHIPKIPFIIQNNAEIDQLVEKCLTLSKKDWDLSETSWNFSTNIFLNIFESTGKTLMKDIYKVYIETNNLQRNELKIAEERINQLFIKIYNLQNELDYKVDEENLTIRKQEYNMDVREFISYVVGCMFGRYSLKNKKIIYTSFKLNDFDKRNEIYDEDNILPITDEEYFNDDIVSKFVNFIKSTFGSDTLEENLDFIAKALNSKGTNSRQIIRNYFINNFFKDHCDMYSVAGSGKRPIYWLFDSGKQNGFKALIYMHRYDRDTVGRIRSNYLHKTQNAIEGALKNAEYIISSSSSAVDKAKATKDRDRYIKQLSEIRIYDQALAHVALQRIDIDLDDGVKHNYELFQGIEVASEGAKKQTIDLLAKL